MRGCEKEHRVRSGMCTWNTEAENRGRDLGCAGGLAQLSGKAGITMVITLHPTVITCNYGNSNLRSNITMKELPFGILRPRSFSGCISWTSLRTVTTVPLPYR